jgi:Protein of unknown function (DUF1003)
MAPPWRTLRETPSGQPSVAAKSRSTSSGAAGRSRRSRSNSPHSSRPKASSPGPNSVRRPAPRSLASLSRGGRRVATAVRSSWEPAASRASTTATASGESCRCSASSNTITTWSTSRRPSSPTTSSLAACTLIRSCAAARRSASTSAAPGAASSRAPTTLPSSRPASRSASVQRTQALRAGLVSRASSSAIVFPCLPAGRLHRWVLPIPHAQPVNPVLLHHAHQRAEYAQNKLADAITAFAGSMLFVYIHLLWFGCWIAFGVEKHPFGLLTMIVSLEAIFLSTFVLISQNRADARRQVIADQQWTTVQQEEQQKRAADLALATDPRARHGGPRLRRLRPAGPRAERGAAEAVATHPGADRSGSQVHRGRRGRKWRAGAELKAARWRHGRPGAACGRREAARGVASPAETHAGEHLPRRPAPAAARPARSPAAELRRRRRDLRVAGRLERRSSAWRFRGSWCPPSARSTSRARSISSSASRWSSRAGGTRCTYSAASGGTTTWFTSRCPPASPRSSTSPCRDSTSCPRGVRGGSRGAGLSGSRRPCRRFWRPSCDHAPAGDDASTTPDNAPRIAAVVLVRS